jgi:hypothetical protein
MPFPIRALKKRIMQGSPSNMPRGELWLGTELFKSLGLDDTVESHLVLAERLDHAMVCLSVSDHGAVSADSGYRYFTVKEVKQGIASGNKPVFAVIDGPFQALVNTLGLMNVLTGWMSDREEIVKAYRVESEKRLELIFRVLEHPPAAVVITDDMAFDNGPLIRPEDLATLCGSFYEKAIQCVHQISVPVLLHSCGNISKLIPTFKTWEIDGFAAIQSGLNDLEGLYRGFDSDIMVMAGIESDLLDAGSFSNSVIQQLDHLMSVMGTSGSLILSSSCGLYKREYLEQIKRIYALVGRNAL